MISPKPRLVFRDTGECYPPSGAWKSILRIEPRFHETRPRSWTRRCSVSSSLTWALGLGSLAIVVAFVGLLWTSVRLKTQQKHIADLTRRVEGLTNRVRVAGETEVKTREVIEAQQAQLRDLDKNMKWIDGTVQELLRVLL